MSVQPELARVDNGHDVPLMWHVESEPGSPIALCGWHFVTRNAAEPIDDLSEVDCVVCAEMEAARQ